MVEMDFVLSEDERIKLISQRSVFVDYLQSAGWINICSLRLEVDNFKCSRCGGDINLVIHHLSYDNLYHEKLSELITLCSICHIKVHKVSPPKVVPIFVRRNFWEN